MIDIFSSIRGNLKFDPVNTDNLVFRAHYKVTFVVLAVCSILVTSRQYFGDPINCIVDSVPGNIMDSYCWIQSTFTLPGHYSGRVGKDVVQPGVGPYVEGEAETRYHTYYQWVCFVLCFQAMAFYVPRYLWKFGEGGRVKTIIMDLASPMIDAETRHSQHQTLARYFTERLHTHNFYAMRFFACELYNFVNVVAQMYFMDKFFGNEFSTYGADVLRISEMDAENRDDPMSRVFPKMTKCTFHSYGPSGTIQKLDSLCVLPLNILNEKIYVFLWFYFIGLLLMSFAALLYRVATVTMKSFRALTLRSISCHSDQQVVDTIIEALSFGDWFILYQVGKNMDSMVFKEFLSVLARSLVGREEEAGATLVAKRPAGLEEITSGN